MDETESSPRTSVPRLTTRYLILGLSLAMCLSSGKAPGALNPSRAVSKSGLKVAKCGQMWPSWVHLATLVNLGLRPQFVNLGLRPLNVPMFLVLYGQVWPSMTKHAQTGINMTKQGHKAITMGTWSWVPGHDLGLTSSFMAGLISSRLTSRPDQSQLWFRTS